ncbi:fibronectin type III domain-containing protein [Oribacterium sp. WCC10]|uniref:fibronectin type III domain-containing protein n=1 Tax=Oribacterium sp. WCC10 TaxID=1855343 RepID=UPI0008E2013D|nr:fibronectin type III domain-containing protein [Oribacterium sp. WCC10]SFG26741.1 hypothetical protein SAMN05216356_104163 [Oribacterium sp. WCC10]
MKLSGKVLILAAVLSIWSSVSALASDAPTGVSIEQSGNEITVSWSPADFDGVDKYQVSVVKKGNSSGSSYRSATVDADESSADFTISNKGYYYAKVRAKDVNNKWHSWSADSETITVTSSDISDGGKSPGGSGSSGRSAVIPSSTGTVIYTTDYTGTNTAYLNNGTVYNTASYGPTGGNLAAAGLTTLSDPNAMNPTLDNVYSSSSNVVNTMKVTAFTYANTGWQFESNGMWYLYDDGTYPVSCWRQIDGKYYHFNKSGYLEVNTWVLESNQKWRYVGPNAVMVTGWNLINGRYYYFSPSSGELQGPGLIAVDGKYYYIDRNGARVENTTVEGHYFGADGALTNG